MLNHPCPDVMAGIAALMCAPGPGDEDLRSALCALYEVEAYEGQPDAQLVQVNLRLLRVLANSSSRDILYKARDKAFQEGDSVGWALRELFEEVRRAKGKEIGRSNMSLASLIDGAVSWSDVKQRSAIRVGMKPGTFDRDVWRKYRGVAHLWTACIYEWQISETFCVPCLPSNFRRFMAFAKIFRTLSATYTPRQQGATLVPEAEIIDLNWSLLNGVDIDEAAVLTARASKHNGEAETLGDPSP